jgi:hypothetical protein
MDSPPPSSTHPGEGSLHSENLMSLSEEERNPRHYRQKGKKNKCFTLKTEQILRNVVSFCTRRSILVYTEAEFWEVIGTKVL